MPNKIQKLYCYVDETGQDTRSSVFIVVAILTSGEQQALKNKLLEIEAQTNVNQRKWRKSRSPNRELFLQKVLAAELGHGGVYYTEHRKPVDFLWAVMETITKAVRLAAIPPYQLITYVDGIDKQKAIQLTKELRKNNIKTKFVRSIDDESEVIIRLADRWAGTIRAALEKESVNSIRLVKSLRIGYLKRV